MLLCHVTSKMLLCQVTSVMDATVSRPSIRDVTVSRNSVKDTLSSNIKNVPLPSSTMLLSQVET